MPPPASRPVRLLICTTDGANAFNGINAWLLGFLPALLAAGHQPAVLIFAWSPPDSCTTYPLLRAAGIETSVVYPPLYTEAAVRRCVREARARRAEIFVANHVVPALHALPALRCLGIPGVSVLHNDDAEYRAKARFLADATVVISNGLKHLLPPSDTRLVRRIPYGTALTDRSAVPPAPPTRLRLVYHGRIATTQKRILETADAFLRVCRAHPQVSADIYGSGPAQDALRDKLRADDANGRVRYLGPRSSLEIRELLPDYHVAVLLSDFEGLGLAILESMSAGLVPVCLRTESGLPDIVRHGENGLFVTDRDQSFSAAIQALIDDPSAWPRYSAAALATVRDEFSPSNCLHAWVELLDHLRSLPLRASPAPPAISPPDAALAAEDFRHPGLVRALWRWLRLGPPAAPLPW